MLDEKLQTTYQTNKQTNISTIIIDWLIDYGFTPYGQYSTHVTVVNNIDIAIVLHLL